MIYFQVWFRVHFEFGVRFLRYGKIKVRVRIKDVIRVMFLFRVGIN